MLGYEYEHPFNTICAICGFTYGSHLVSQSKTSDGKRWHPIDQCPTGEDSEEWNEFVITTFKAEEN
jgi:hypothetical protein